MLSLPPFLCLLLAFPLSFAIPFQDHAHESVARALPNQWYHPEDHPIRKLFRRDPVGDGTTYADVGTPEWRQSFPPGVPDTTQLPQVWVDAFNAAVAAGKIPNIPQSTNTPGVNPVYPGGINPGGPDVCSSTYKCRMPEDIWDAPTGVIGAGFDDGPYAASSTLYNFLQSQNQRATHFMIGVNILANPVQFNLAFATLEHDIAVHTYTHPYMTTLDNLSIVGQLGWTMQLIHNSTGGRVPKYWRPPYGDSDNRVRAIAKEVFGLTTIVWNQDSSDWSIGQPGGPTIDVVNHNMQQWLTGPKTPGLIILEHELIDAQFQVFMTAYPLMISNGWNVISVSELGPTGSAYQNTNGTEGPVTLDGILVSTPSPTSSVAPSTSSSTAAPSATHEASVNGAISTYHRTIPRLGTSLSLGLAILAGMAQVA